MTDQLVSVMLYLLVFGAALFFFWVAEGQYKKAALEYGPSSKSSRWNERFAGNLCAYMGILIVCLFAAVRATSVGADTRGYPVVYTDMAAGCDSFYEFLQCSPDMQGEPLGAILIWFCSSLDFGIVPLLFCYQFLTIYPVYLAIQKLEGKIPLSIAMSVYLFCFFNNSLNMMRQSVACALILLAVVIYLTCGRMNAKTLFLCIAALLFHRSSVYGLLLLAPTLLVAKADFKKMRFAIYALIAASPLAITQISAWLINSGLADAHARYYLDVFVLSRINLSWKQPPIFDKHCAP